MEDYTFMNVYIYTHIYRYRYKYRYRYSYRQIDCQQQTVWNLISRQTTEDRTINWSLQIYQWCYIPGQRHQSIRSAFASQENKSKKLQILLLSNVKLRRKQVIDMTSQSTHIQICFSPFNQRINRFQPQRTLNL